VDLVLLLKAAIMGIVEGLTEFLPISSTGHLILAGALLGMDDAKAQVFDIAIQTGAILAVIIVYWQKIRSTLVQLPTERQAQRFALNVLIAFLPAVVLGLLFGKAIKAHLFTPVVVASAFIVGGFIILWAERRQQNAATAPRIHDVDQMTPMDALKVGLVQCLAMIPGTSRSGATIIGGMFMGLSRKAATDFSFYLAIPHAHRRGCLQPVQGLGTAVHGRHPDVRRGSAVLLRQRLDLRALAAALHRHAHLRGLRVVPHRLRHRGAGDGVDGCGGLEGVGAPPAAGRRSGALQAPHQPGRGAGPADPPEPCAARDGAGRDHAIDHQGGALRGEHVAQLPAEAQRQPAADSCHHQPTEVAEDGPQQAARALGGEVQHQSHAEEAVQGAHGAQVQCAGVEHGRIVAEEHQPGAREQGRSHPDGLREREGDGRTDPGHPHGAFVPARTHAGPDHGHQGGAEAEDQRHQQVFQPRSGAVPGDGAPRRNGL
jgi:undecaprenyl-diphosphatase